MQSDAEEVQTRYYYDLDMNVLSCQAIYPEELPTQNYPELCVLANLLNEAIGFGSFIILEKESLIFEINHLTDSESIISEDILDKISMIPSEALIDHIALFRDVANGKKTAVQALEEAL